jgi:uncharacterized protein (TIGR02147 family)
MPSVFDYSDYRRYIVAKRQENQSIRGYQSAMAKAAGCQRAYLSQVLHSHVQLTPDHAFGLAQFFGLSDDERSYFLDLVASERANSKSLRIWLEGRLEAARKAHSNVATRLAISEVRGAEVSSEYYARWYMSAIHILVGIPAFQSETEIARRLRLDRETVRNALLALERMSLVARRGNGWMRTASEIHAGRGPFSVINNLAWRTRAMQSIPLEDQASLHYTGVHSIGRTDIARIRSLLLECIGASRAIVAPSPDEDLICIGVDLFRV